MNILLTNDDGYQSEGLLLVKNKLMKYGRVVVVAPLHHMSGKSVSITLGRPYQVEEKEKDVYACDGTPADCVAFALSYLGIEFDLVVSGCNHGLNISYDTMYSGTVAACLQTLVHHIPTFAVSCESNFEIVDKYFDDVYDFIMKKNLLGNDYLLNINFPKGTEVKDICLSTLYYCEHELFVSKKEDGYYSCRIFQKDFSDQPESDCYMINHDIISITPLYRTYFNQSLYEELKKKI